jgi:pyridinium-3,5-bisthiocarboxylic acid mononucleotide nickel chelatase
MAAFRLLGEAEGRVHGVSPDAVALHEVGAVDALVDIVGALEGFEHLGVTRVYSRPVAVGSGWVRAAHGVIPIPAPATAVLLEGLEVGPNGPVVGEATTPTGAVLLRVLSEGAPPAKWRAVAGGAWGAGGRNPAGYPNALRLILAEPAAEAGEVVLLSTDVDDLSPEYLDPLREALFAAGALDVQLWSTQMKKGRTGFRVEITVAPAEADRVAQALFRHSTTAGIRRQVAERVTLPRRELQLDAGNGMRVRVKVLDGPDGPRVKPEYDDIAAVASRTGRPAHEVARDLQSRALRLVSPDGAAGH